MKVYVNHNTLSSVTSYCHLNVMFTKGKISRMPKPSRPYSIDKKLRSLSYRQFKKEIDSTFIIKMESRITSVPTLLR